jgi:rhodanese-related sulfurtransferase
MTRLALILGLLFTIANATLLAGDKPPRIQKLLDETKAQINEIDAAQLVDLKEVNPDLLIIDIREPGEWKQGHLKEAELVTRGVVEFRIERMAPKTDTPIVLYCAGGNRSALAADRLEQMGYTAVYSVIGGFSSIVANGGFEVEIPK